MQDDSPPPTDDPEILALLDFEPVVRKCKRHDGWTPANQRRYIVGLAETGNTDRAAQAFGRTESGAWKVRCSAGAEGFAAAWDGALALYHRRNPRALSKGRPSRGEILAGSGRAWPAAAAPAVVDREAEERAKEVGLDAILEKYLIKLGMEREARLGGRVVEADYYVRQLTWLEVALDLGGRGMDVLKEFRRLNRGGYRAGKIVATPMSLLLDQARRLLWEEEGGPERPPLPPLGEHDGEVATGLPLECQHRPEHDGDWKEWRRRQDEIAALAAEAQRLWEEKAKKDAAAWRARMAREAPGELSDLAADAEHPSWDSAGDANATEPPL